MRHQSVLYSACLAFDPNNRYQAWVDHLNSVIEVMPLGARLDVPLLRRAMSDSDPRAPGQQQKQLAATAGAGGGLRPTTCGFTVFPSGAKSVGLSWSPNCGQHNKSSLHLMSSLHYCPTYTSYDPNMKEASYVILARRTDILFSSFYSRQR